MAGRGILNARATPRCDDDPDSERNNMSSPRVGSKKPLSVKPMGAPKTHNVQVCCRVRPMNEREKDEVICVRADALTGNVTIRNKNFNGFDKVYGPSSTQIDIYRELVAPQVDDVLKGYNCTVFAYGQTGTGKTFTMEGGDGSMEKDWETDPATGIIPRAIQHIFSQLSKIESEEYVVRVSYIEIYNEEMVDLLAPNCEDNGRIRMFEDPAKKGSVVLTGVEEAPVRSRDDVYKLLRMGTERRRTAETLMNQRSSRSHSVFTVNVVIRESTPTGEELVKQGKLRLVDLAGSESIGRSGAEGKRAKEAGNINQSLLTLGRVITALTSNAPHVPYRESKLTRLLQDSLGGSTITTIIATLSPANSNYEESLSTLEYAHRAKNIKNHPELNQKLSRKDLFKGYNDEIERLRRDLRAAREKNGVYVDEEQYEGMEKKLVENAEKISELEEQLEVLLGKIARSLEDMELMDEQYRKVFGRMRAVEDRLGQRIGELEETAMQLAEEKETVRVTRRALDRSIQHANLAHGEANELLSIAQDAHSECGQLHARADAIIEIAKANRDTALKVGSDVSSLVPSIDTRSTATFDAIHGQYEVIRDANESLASSALPLLRSTRDAVLDTEETLKTAFVDLSSLDDKMVEERKAAMAAVAEETEKAKDDTIASLRSALSSLESTTNEQRDTIQELQTSSDKLAKELSHWRNTALLALEESARARSEAESKSKQIEDDFVSKLHSILSTMVAASSTARTDASSRAVDLERQVKEAIEKEDEVHDDIDTETKKTTTELGKAVADGLRAATEAVSATFPILECAAESVNNEREANTTALHQWMERKEERCTSTRQQIAQKNLNVIDNIDGMVVYIDDGTAAIRGSTTLLTDEVASGRLSTKASIDQLSATVSGNLQRIRTIPPKDIDAVDRDMEYPTVPPTERTLFAEDGEESEEQDENAGKDFDAPRRKKARRSAFRVRDSILVPREPIDLHSPTKVAAMRATKIDEEDESASFASDRTNRLHST